MSFYDVAGAMIRRWYVALVALGLAVGLWQVWAADSGCFTTSTVVTFTLPMRATLLPESGAEDESVIAFAGVVANEINAGRPAPRYASRDAPLYGVGVRRGVIVGLPDSGGQWASAFARAEIEIQIVGRSYEEVRERQTALLRRVFQITRDQQSAAGSNERIRASVVPLTSGIQEVRATRSSQILALGALVVCALLGAGWLSVSLERWRDSRKVKKTTSVVTEANETKLDRV